MDIIDQLKLTPESLAKVQLDALKAHAVGILNTVSKFIQSEEWDKINSMLKKSPAGDGTGMDNCFIDFKFSGVDSGDDIYELTSKLKHLKSKASGNLVKR